jgi:outer membrane immunogenic protein
MEVWSLGLFVKKILAAAALVGLSATSAFAADMAVKAPIYTKAVSPAYNWTGFYVGADIGGGWMNDRVFDFFTATGIQNFQRFGLNSSGVLGGLFAGYNWQTSANLVFGVEGDIEATALKSQASSFTLIAGGVAVPPGNGTANVSLPWQGSLRARLGYAAGPALYYLTGGLAVAEINTQYATLAGNIFANPPGSSSFSSTRVGWTLGTGFEYAFAPNWTARAEYRYTDYGNFSDTIVTNAALANGQWDLTTARHSVNESVVRVGIAYKFGAPVSAVAAKY